jgi:nucleoside-diphosphate-sugar epimerase
MNVFLTGATGYIGGAIADALQRTGHMVLGLAHSDKSAKVLQERSMSPLRGDLRDPASLAQGARQADAVIHAATTNSSDMAEADIAAVETILAALEGTHKPFIYTSGCWVLGNSGDTIADEESPTDPPAIVAWRPALERRCTGYFGHPFEKLSTLSFATLFFFVLWYSFLKLQGNVSKALVLPF